VAAELKKQIGWSEARPALFHFRTHAGQEVDLVLEDARGRVVGIEVKASATVTASDLAGLRVLAETAGRKFVQGVALHLGRETVPFGPNLAAVPLEALWAEAAAAPAPSQPLSATIAPGRRATGRPPTAHGVVAGRARVDAVAAVERREDEVVVGRVADHRVEVDDGVERRLGPDPAVHLVADGGLGVVPAGVGARGRAVVRGMMVTPTMGRPRACTRWMMFAIPSITCAAEASRRMSLCP